MLPHRARWAYLDIDLDEENLPIFDAAMPLVRHSELTTMSVEEGVLDPIGVHQMPLLRTVVLNELALRITLPWTQLTSLSLTSVFPSECVSILVHTQNLVHCRLDVYFGGPNESQRDIVLGFLESLVLTHAGGLSEAHFLSSFFVPALHRLQLSEPFLAPNPVGSLTAFISKSGCTLETLYIARARLAPEASYRQALPSLRKLYINGKMIHQEDCMDLGSTDS
ncbi:hypothetical protein C8R47DRAFT_170584 [Mycena vitilis]|nr:hypothetical protein C8R47DRAFT_170584 [Mycena vitilis]